MGRFVNPGNSAFAVALNSEIYVDKTELLEYTNKWYLIRKDSNFMKSPLLTFRLPITYSLCDSFHNFSADGVQFFAYSSHLLQR